MLDSAGHPIHEGDRVRVTRSSRSRVGWVVKVVDVALDDELDVAGVLVASEPGGQWTRTRSGWCRWVNPSGVEVLAAGAAEGGG